MSKRLDALTGRLAAPLLVDPGGAATLFTDFRYIELARGVPGVDAEMAKRALISDVGSRLTGRVQDHRQAHPDQHRVLQRDDDGERKGDR